MFSNEEIILMEQLCSENSDMNFIIEKFKNENRQTLSTFTHEISNSFTLIASTVQIMENRNPDIKNIYHWNQLSKDIKDLSGLLRELSTYNQCTKLNMSNVNLITLLTEIQNSFQETSQQKDITLSLDIGKTTLPHLCDYLCDSIKLRQVFFNIIKNAFEATSPGNFIKIVLPKATSDFYNYDKDKTFMVISIMNNGLPIPSDKIDTIFTPFLTTKPTGTGLGLSIAHKILSAHGGCIKVDSTNELTTFSIYLPIEKGPLLSQASFAS